jgi:hypothetical protein
VHCAAMAAVNQANDERGEATCDNRVLSAYNSVPMLFLQGLSSKPIAFLRTWDLALFLLRSKLAASVRAKARLWQEQEQMFGDITTDHVMASLFGIVFCIQAPLIAPICLYYFAVNLAIEKYNALYVFSRPYESGGLLWAKVGAGGVAGCDL